MKIKAIIFFGIIICCFNCSDHKSLKLTNKKHDEYLGRFATLIASIQYTNDIVASQVDTVGDEDFRQYLLEPLFGRLDSVRISLYGYHKGRNAHELVDTLLYTPTVMILPANYSDADFYLAYSVNSMKLKYLEFQINFKAQNGGYEKVL